MRSQSTVHAYKSNSPENVEPNRPDHTHGEHHLEAANPCLHEKDTTLGDPVSLDTTEIEDKEVKIYTRPKGKAYLATTERHNVRSSALLVHYIGQEAIAVPKDQLLAKLSLRSFASARL